MVKIALPHISGVGLIRSMDTEWKVRLRRIIDEHGQRQTQTQVRTVALWQPFGSGKSRAPTDAHGKDACLSMRC